MMSVAEPGLSGRLSALEAKGRGVLRGEARRHALRLAMTIGLRVTPVAPAVALVTGRHGPGAVLATTIGLSVLVGAAVFIRRMASFADPSSVALAHVDRRLGLGDRAVVSAEFLAAPADGFRAAALDEAAPWLDCAAAAPIDPVPVPVWPARREWLYLAAAALMVVALLVAPTPSVDGSGARPAVGITADTGGTAAREAPSPLPWLVARTTAALTGRSDGAGGGGSGGRSGGASSGATGGAAGRGAAQEAAERDDAGTGAAAPGGRPGAAGGAPAGSGSGGGGEGGGAASMAGDERSVPGAATPPADVTARAPVGMAAATAGGGWPGGAMPPGGARPGTPREGTGGDGNRRSSSSSQGDGAASASRPGEGQGDGAGTGQDAIKRSRGLAAVLLAVPMEDKLVGTPGTGPARTALRRTDPRTDPAGTVTAGTRGVLSRDIGRIPRRVATAQDERLVARYFDRTGGR